jgi:hypothetical protein
LTAATTHQQMMSNLTYYFHRSGQITCQPATTEHDIDNLVALTERIADTSDAVRSARVMRSVIAAFSRSAESNSLRSDLECDQLLGLLKDVEDYWADIALADVSAQPAPRSTVAP